LKRPAPRSFALLLALVLAAFAVAACGGGSTRQTSKVFTAPPWTGPEQLSYNLSRRGEPSAGTCELKTEPDFEPGRTRLSHHCGKDEFSDDAAAIVDAKTLKPITATRTTIDTRKERKTVWTNSYENTVVRFEAETNGSASNTSRDLPKPDATSPDPGWYEDATLLWLARGIPLQAGFTASYAHVINAGQPRVITVDVKVGAPEKVDVPAGAFSAWKIRIVGGNATYTIWVDDQPPHRVVRAVIEDLTYALTAAK
jgi:hypothetical protein